jgi:adenine-specific DNA-methyltransferase
VSGPFTFEATIAGAIDIDGDGTLDITREEAIDHAAYVERMIAILRRSSVLHVGGNHRVLLHGVRAPTRALTIGAEAWVEAMAHGQKPSIADAVEEAEARRGDRLDLSRKQVAILFGPEHAAVSEKLVFDAAREARAKGYTHLYVIGFNIHPNARELIERCEGLVGVPATYIQASPDLAMADLLKQTRASQIFSVVGRPDAIARATNDNRWEVELLGVDTFDPVTMEARKLDGKDAAAWLLDVAWDGHVFHVSQAFFPRTRAWDALKRDLRADFAESLWEHLAGTVSAPFTAKKGDKVAIKVIDDRGNELLRVLTLGED